MFCEEFSKCMHSEFEMSMMGELNFFLELQIKQLKGRNLHQSSKVYKRSSQGRSQNNEDSNEFIHQG